jgi:hypothetical protein
MSFVMHGVTKGYSPSLLSQVPAAPRASAAWGACILPTSQAKSNQPLQDGACPPCQALIADRNWNKATGNKPTDAATVRASTAALVNDTRPSPLPAEAHHASDLPTCRAITTTYINSTQQLLNIKRSSTLSDTSVETAQPPAAAVNKYNNGTQQCIAALAKFPDSIVIEAAHRMSWLATAFANPCL